MASSQDTGSDADDSGSELSYSESGSDSPDEGEEGQAAGAGRVIRPYRFEPEVEDGEDDPGAAAPLAQGGGDPDPDPERRLGNNAWCSCSGRCSSMPTVKESVCCKDIEQVVEKMDSFEGEQLDCIRHHPGFSSGCLDRYVLEIAYYQYRSQYRGLERVAAPEHERNRHVAYRQLVRWCWGYLGRSIRVPLPSCAVTKIRETFPSDGYQGFQEP